MSDTPQEARGPEPVRAVWWEEGALCAVDQRRLPEVYQVMRLTEAEAVREAIAGLAIRGAPAIGIAAAFGLYLGMRAVGPKDWDARLSALADAFVGARPTAVNLAWAVRRVVARAGGSRDPERLLAEAKAIFEAEREASRRIGAAGARLLAGVSAVLTHCNAGALGTAEWGTALAPLYALKEAGQVVEVYADETRPLWQGARLTAWELARAGIPVTVLPDGAAAVVLRQRRVGAVVVGADRIAANGDTANKIGTYGLALAARHHGVPFYVAAPRSTVDLGLPSGEAIPIEHRPAREVTHVGSLRVVAEGAAVFNPAFDVTPAELITAFITDCGVIYPPYAKTLPAALAESQSNAE
ncbi:MAG: S-methyl-5-thioribose-1-phosphate isomerase [Firmicutes bacterium]|nr:S-methyl-5-thioribose-1-phosphate isomerase [Alicyclobacillaceae bacterium]MCL6497119.1 S-methyl-5-thioribose-1-phosphate isomerase [Bacillota bacterium]